MDNEAHFIDSAPPLAAALTYHHRGWCPIPLFPGEKIPRKAWKIFQKVRPDKKLVQKWWNSNPRDGVGVITGSVSGGLVAVDIDRRNGGEHSAKGLSLPETLTHSTHDGSRRFYRLSHPLPSRKGVFPGVDLLANGSFVVMPPSQHPKGGQYRIESELPIPPAPPWIHKALIEKISSLGPFSSQIPVGNRHESLKRSIRGYANDSRTLVHLWKRSIGLVRGFCEYDPKNPFTFTELFNIVLWAWNEGHSGERFSTQTGQKILLGRQSRTRDLILGPWNVDLISFHPTTSTSTSKTKT